MARVATRHGLSDGGTVLGWASMLILTLSLVTVALCAKTICTLCPATIIALMCARRASTTMRKRMRVKGGEAQRLRKPVTQTA